jgi:hypothetical protein
LEALAARVRMDVMSWVVASLFFLLGILALLA